MQWLQGLSAGIPPGFEGGDEAVLQPLTARGLVCWWVSGENTKSALSQSTAATDILGWAERLASSTRPDSSAFDITAPNELDRVSRRSSVDQVSSRGTNVISVSKEYFHDLTHYSRGLLTNTATGGWRRDLSLLSEQWTDVSTGDFTPSGLPMFTLEPGVQTEARKAGDGVTSSGALIYPWAVEGSYLDNADNSAIPINTPGSASGSWDGMVDFATKYKQILSGSANGNVVLSADVTNFRDEVGPTLVLSRIHSSTADLVNAGFLLDLISI